MNVGSFSAKFQLSEGKNKGTDQMMKPLSEIVQDLLNGLEMNSAGSATCRKTALNPPLREGREGNPHAIEFENPEKRPEGFTPPASLREETKQSFR